MDFMDNMNHINLMNLSLLLINEEERLNKKKRQNNDENDEDDDYYDDYGYEWDYWYNKKKRFNSLLFFLSLYNFFVNFFKSFFINSFWEH